VLTDCCVEIEGLGVSNVEVMCIVCGAEFCESLDDDMKGAEKKAIVGLELLEQFPGLLMALE
jgi:hypothetical protein